MAEEKKAGIGGIPGTTWRLIAAFFIVSVIIYSWNIFSSTGAPEKYTLNYSQFLDQLNAGNIKSVSMKKLHVTGELIKEVSIPYPGQKKPAQVKYFQTILPFQGEALLSQLREKKVIITIEPEKQGLFRQMLIGILPWALIIGVWVFISMRNQKLQGGGGRTLCVRDKQGKTV